MTKLFRLTWPRRRSIRTSEAHWGGADGTGSRFLDEVEVASEKVLSVQRKVYPIISSNFPPFSSITFPIRPIFVAELKRWHQISFFTRHGWDVIMAILVSFVLNDILRPLTFTALVIIWGIVINHPCKYNDKIPPK